MEYRVRLGLLAAVQTVEGTPATHRDRVLDRALTAVIFGSEAFPHARQLRRLRERSSVM